MPASRRCGACARAGFTELDESPAFGFAANVRIAASAALLAVMGAFMGMAFPLGMRLAMASRAELGPWLWGVNGATSVLASVLAVVIAMAAGISASFWTGVAAYVVAVASFALAARPRAV